MDAQGAPPYFPTQKRWKIRSVTSSRTDWPGELTQGGQGLLHVGEQGIGGDPQVQGLSGPADGLQRASGGLRLALVGEQLPIAGAGIPGEGLGHQLRQTVQARPGFGADRDGGGQVQRFRPLQLAGQVLLVQDHDGGGAFDSRPDQGGVLLPGGLGLIQHHQDELRLLHGPAAALHPQLLNGIAAVPKTCRVDEPQRDAPQLHRLLHRVPGGPGDVGHDGPVVARQGVEQGGLARIGPARMGQASPLGQPEAPGPAGHQLPQGPLLGVQGAGQLLPGEGVDVLVGVIQHGVEVGHDVHQGGIDFPNPLGQRPRPGVPPRGGPPPGCWPPAGRPPPPPGSDPDGR